MSKSSFQQKPAEPEPQVDGAQFNVHRNGKPDSNCRTCNDFKSWSKQQRLISNTQAAKEKHIAASEKLTVNAAGVAAPREDCPLDKVRLGISTWGLLHTMAAFYSDNPTDTEKRDMRTFFEVLSRLYPCEYCAKDFRSDIEVNPVNVNSQKDLAMWLCNFHNRVNDKLGKPLFDCSKVNERWRDGWLDGSCD
ncbi:FAD-linked sulfhydryl oxidase ALR [Drosophila mojavensis]|nr:FAD-linked sulfhydryl oxidase ALR [Drosophila mojavensis]